MSTPVAFRHLWDLVNDFDRMTEWVTFAEELRYLSPGEVGEGTVYREYGGVGPISGESEWEITAFEPSSRQVHVGDLGIMRPELIMTFEEREGGALSRRLERVYLPLISVLLLGWLFRITIFVPAERPLEMEAVPGVPGIVVDGVVGMTYLGALLLALWPTSRQAKGEFHGEEPGDWKTEE